MAHPMKGMAHPMKKKRQPGEDDFALLLEPEAEAEEEAPESFEEDEYADEDDAALFEEEPMMAEGDMMGPGLDPEQAQLAETLGFTEPEQQQALIDLIKLVAAPAPEGF